MVDLFTQSEIARALDVDVRRLGRLMQLGVVLPVRRSRGRGDSALYTFGSVSVLAALQALEAEGVSYTGRALLGERYGAVLDAAATSRDGGDSLLLVSDADGPRVVDRRDVKRGASFGIRVEFGPLVRQVRRALSALRSTSGGCMWESWHLRPAADVARAWERAAV